MDFSFLNVYRESFINGFLMTLAVSITALFFSLLIGIVIAMLRFSRVKLLEWLGAAYVEFFRNTPLVIQIFFFTSD